MEVYSETGLNVYDQWSSGTTMKNSSGLYHGGVISELWSDIHQVRLALFSVVIYGVLVTCNLHFKIIVLF